MGHRKYLDDIGYIDELEKLDEKDYGGRWEKQLDVFGFDDRDTWNLNNTMLALLYERLKMFQSVSNINMDFHIVEHRGEKITQREALDLMCERAEEALTRESNPYVTKLLEDEEKLFGRDEEGESSDDDISIFRTLLGENKVQYWYHKRWIAVENDAMHAADEVWELWSKTHCLFWW